MTKVQPVFTYTTADSSERLRLAIEALSGWGEELGFAYTDLQSYQAQQFPDPALENSLSRLCSLAQRDKLMKVAKQETLVSPASPKFKM